MYTRIRIYQVGSAVVDLHEDHDEYSGTIYAGEHAWRFDGLRGPAVGVHDERALAIAACSFGGYFTTHNRGAKLPDWAPAADTADAISDATCCAEEAEEVEELDDLPEWCSTVEVAHV